MRTVIVQTTEKRIEIELSHRVIEVQLGVEKAVLERDLLEEGEKVIIWWFK